MTGPDRLDVLLIRLQADPRFVRNGTAWRTLAGEAFALIAWPS